MNSVLSRRSGITYVYQDPSKDEQVTNTRRQTSRLMDADLDPYQRAIAAKVHTPSAPF